MRRSVRILVPCFSAFAGVFVACGFSITGDDVAPDSDAGIDQRGRQGDASPSEPPPGPDGAASLGDPQLGDDDAGVESDAALFDDAGCGPTTFTENFAGGLTNWTTYGPVVLRTNGPQGNYARLIENQASVASGLFWLPKPKAKELHVTFRYRVDVPQNTTYIGDGLTFTWLTDTGSAGAIGASAVNGQGLGLWPGPSGYAFILDAWRNGNIEDEEAPYFSFIHIENGKGKPGDYPWHVKQSPPYDYSVFDRWWPVDITIAGGLANAMVASSRVIRDAPLDTGANITAIGFTAATGGAYAIQVSIDTVTIELKSATCN